MSSMWLTDVCLIYSPPVIALAAVLHAVSRCKENIDDFVVRTIMKNPSEDVLRGMISEVRSEFSFYTVTEQ